MNRREDVQVFPSEYQWYCDYGNQWNVNGNNILINKRNTIHPHKFALWAAMASITMMFGAFTSAYIVKQAAGNWLEFAMPNEFYLSTLMILVSSITLHISFKAFKSGS